MTITNDDFEDMHDDCCGGRCYSHDDRRVIEKSKLEKTLRDFLDSLESITETEKVFNGDTLVTDSVKSKFSYFFPFLDKQADKKEEKQ